MKALVYVLVIFLLPRGRAKPLEQNLGSSKLCHRNGPCHHVEELPKISGTDLDLGRLPHWLIPYHYNIELQPHFYDADPPFFFDGSVEIFMDCMEATDTIYLSALGQEITESSLQITIAPGSPVQPDPPEWISFEMNALRQFMIIYLDRELTVGAKYQLSVSYTGELRGPETPAGFYWDFYQTEAGPRYLVTTQFQSSHARHALPCFDEPEFKATFNTTLVKKSQWISLSNMQIVTQESRGDDWVADVYDTTVLMSNYLLCFTVCDFLFVQSVTPRGTVTRIWARSDMIETAEYANQIAGDIMEWFEDYTGIPYILPKTDHIALPNKGGAMENYGLITYGEYGRLLYDPARSTTTDKFYVALYVTHEIAHMWFGNLVTMAWWSHTWLNEGLASYFEYPALQDLYGWTASDLQVVELTQYIMGWDALNTSVPVRIDIDTPWEAGSSFSSFTYYKGGSIVRSIMTILGPDTFRRGLTRYLERFEYGVVVTDDLWDVLTEQAELDGVTDTDGSKLDMKQKMDPFIEQIGFPLVTVDRSGGMGADTTQSIFLNPTGQQLPTSPFDYKWNVPVNFYTEEDSTWNTTTREWMNSEDKIANKNSKFKNRFLNYLFNDTKPLYIVLITEGVPENPNDWMIINTDTDHYYRTDYDQVSREAIVQALISNHQSIAVGDRSQFISDTFQLCRISHYNEVVGMETTRYLHTEDEYIPWRTVRNEIIYPALILLRFTQTYVKFQDYMNGQVDRVYNQLGWVHEEEDSALLNQLLRGIILRLACTYNTADCIDEAISQYGQWKADINNNPVHPDNRMTVYCTAIGYGDQSDWEFAHSTYLAYGIVLPRTPEAAQVIALLLSMACSTDTDVLQTYLEYTFNDTLIYSVDANYALSAIAESAVGRQVVWQHLKDNWLGETTPTGGSKYSLLLTTVSGFATAEDLLELENFIATYPPGDETEQETYDVAMATVEENKRWADVNVDELDDWLTEHAPGEDQLSLRENTKTGVIAPRLSQMMDDLTQSLHPGRSFVLH